MKRTIKIPETLFRSAQVTTAGEGEAKSLRMSISSDVPYKRYDFMADAEYYEVLDHGPGGCKDDRLRAGLPILFNHDRNQHLGRATSYTNDGHKLEIGDIVWSADEFAQVKKKDAETGALPDTSVGYRILDDGECIGAKDGIPIYKFKWEIHEASLVTIPADITVGVGRQRSAEQEAKLIEVNVTKTKLVDEPNCAHYTRTTPIHVMPESPAPATEIKPTIDVTRERTEAVQAERKRVADIHELCRHFADKGIAGRKVDAARIAEKVIADGGTVADFQNACLRENLPDVKPIVVEELGMSKKDLSDYSLVRAMRCLAQKRPVDGLEKEASEAHAKLIGVQPEGLGFFIPQDVMNGKRDHRVLDASIRALTTGTYSAAGALVADNLLASSLIELLRNQMKTVSMGARSLSGLSGNVQIPLQSGGATATWLSETGTISESNATVGQLALTPHRLGAATAYTQQLLAQSSIDVENFIRQDLMAVIAIARDLAAIAGTGVSGQPLGILNTSGLSTSVTLSGAQSMTYANAVQFETNVALNNADLGKLGYMVTPTVKNNAKLVAEISAANANPVWKNNQVNGYNAVATNQVPTATSVIFGNWDDLILADWAQTQVIVDPYSLSLQGQVRVVMQMLCDNGLRHAKSFTVSTN
mgnify:CR=1 FL=1